MIPKITLELDPSELYDETDLVMALRALRAGLASVDHGLMRCLVLGKDGEPTDEIERLLANLGRKLVAIERRVLLGNLTVIRK